jgi:hypothetical protein
MCMDGFPHAVGLNLEVKFYEKFVDVQEYQNFNVRPPTQSLSLVGLIFHHVMQ